MSVATEPDHHRAQRKDAVENRRRVIDAARIIFAEHGLDARVEEVAQVARVGIGTLYRHFPTKDALVGELVRELLETVVGLAHDAENVPGGEGLERFLFATAEAQAANRGCLARLWNDSESVSLRQDCFEAAQRLLLDAQRHDRIRADATLTDIDLLFWALRGILEATGTDSAPAWRRQIAITVAGLRPSPEPLAEAAVTLSYVAPLRPGIQISQENAAR